MEHKQTLSDKLRKRFRGGGEVCAKFLLKLGLTPNIVTIIGCAGHLGVFWASWKGLFLLASLLLFVFSVLDFLDGMMARMISGGKGTKFGAVLDSALDRYAEALLYGGLICHFAERGNMTVVLLCLAAIMGAFLVPYLRAKGELYGLDMTLGIMSKFERYFTMGIFLLVSLPIVGLAIVAVLSNVTAMQRLLYIKKHVGEAPEKNKQ